MAAEASRAPSVREQTVAPLTISLDLGADFYIDPENDMSGLCAWVDEEGRFFGVDDDGFAREFRDDDPLPRWVTERAREPRVPFWRRALKAVEPWYDWGRVNAFRLDSHEPDFSDEVEGEVRFFTLQWLGLHIEVQIGRTPTKAVRS